MIQLHKRILLATTADRHWLAFRVVQAREAWKLFLRQQSANSALVPG